MIADAAHSLGYWGVQFSYDIDTEVEPAKVAVTVEPGPLYHVASVNVLRPDGQPLLIPRGGKEDATQTGGPRADGPLVAAEGVLLAGFSESGTPLRKQPPG